MKLPENTKPTITDRDFVVATIAPPTIVKEPEKPAEETAEALKVKLQQLLKVGKNSTEATKDGEAPKKEDKGKGKDQASDKKSAAKPAGDKKQEKK